MIQLVDPEDRTQPLHERDGRLLSAAGRAYPIVDGIPRFVAHADRGQEQTADSFGFKWTRDAHWGFEPEHQRVVWDFWHDIFGWDGPEDLRALMAGKVVLDAGAGAGASLRQFVDWPSAIVAADISAAIDRCRDRFADRPHVSYMQADLTQLPLADDVFDIVWSNGVLHHTPNTFESLRAIVRHLKVGGLVVFYIYVKKAPIREFVDDYLRDRVADLPPAEAWTRMEGVTALGRSLAAITEPITVSEDVPDLGIRRGTYNLQRLLYYTMLKCYWNPAMTFDDNVHVNFDWYHPRYAHRHTPEEVRAWLTALGLDEQSLRVSDSGIAVIARKRIAS